MGWTNVHRDSDNESIILLLLNIDSQILTSPSMPLIVGQLGHVTNCLQY